MAKYVELNPQILEAFLIGCGFSRRVKGSEIVYVKANHHHPDVWIKVYTSLRASSAKARAKGEDAIRVAVAYESDIPFRGRTSFGIYKATKIIRVGTHDQLLERLYQRMREAYGFSNDWLKQNWQALKDTKTHPNGL